MAFNYKVKFTRAVNLFGGLLMLLCIYFIIDRLIGYRSQVSAALNSESVFYIILLGGMHLIALNLLGFAWYRNVLQLKEKLSLKVAIVIYGSSQIGKYLPGNIFHFAGRQWLAKNYAVDQKKILKATLLEIISHLAAVSFVILLLLFFADQLVSIFDEFINEYLIWSVPYFWLLLALLVCVGVLMFSKRKVLFKLARLINKNVALYISFHVIAGLSFFLLVSLFSRSAFELFPVVVVSYLAAWLIGYVVPGAPGGLGVRELALVFLLSPFFSEHLILLLSVGNRLVTTLGDVFYFLQALLVKKIIVN